MQSKSENLFNATNSVLGVNIAGYVNSEFGLGEGVRAIIRAVEAVKIPFVINNCTFNLHRKFDSSYKDFTDDNPYPINLIQVNFDLINMFINDVDPAYFKNRYNIGFWAWELQDFPKEAEPAFNLFNEIWTYSSYCAKAIARKSPIPVIKVMPSISLAHPALSREELDLPQDKFIFLFMFDFCSIFERKNPAATIKAFKQAFGKSNEDVLLVLKFSNAEYFPNQREQLKALVEGDPSIKLIDGYLLKPELNALLYNCDCYVSLHRSEGFGMTMAEAMFYGKPVIATNYSANTEYMNSGNSFPVKYELVTLAEDFLPYKKGNIWANPDLEHAAYLMRYVFDNYEQAKRVGERAAREIKFLLNPQTVGSKIKSRLEDIVQLKNGSNSLSQLQQVQARLTQSHVELVRSQAQLQQTQVELGQSQAQLQQTQVELGRSQAQLQQTQVELGRSQAQLQQTQVELGRSQAQLQQTQVELGQSQAVISGMESSKFWKLRTAWFLIKRMTGLPVDK